MTFSRPNIGPVDAAARVSRVNEQRGADRVYAQDPNTRFSGVDARNPSVLRQAAENDARRTQAFFEGLGNLVDKGFEVVNTQLDTGEFDRVMSDPETKKAIENMTPENRQVFDGLRYNVRLRVAQAGAAQNTISEYNNDYLLQTGLQLPQLSNPETPAAERRLLKQQIQSGLAEKYGINKLPAMVLVATADARRRTEEAVISTITGSEIKKNEAQVKTLQQQGVQGLLTGAVENHKAAARAENPDGERQAVVTQLGNNWRQFLEDNGVDPKEAGTLVGQALMNMSFMVSNGRLSRQDFKKTLDSMDELSQGTKGFRSGMKMADLLTGEDGMTVKALINRLRLANDERMDKDKRDATQDAVARALIPAVTGQVTPKSVTDALVRMAQDPSTDSTVILNALERLRQMEKEPTQQQMMNQLTLQEQINNANPEDRASLAAGAVSRGQITAGQALSLNINPTALAAPEQRQMNQDEARVNDLRKRIDETASEDINKAILEAQNDLKGLLRGKGIGSVGKDVMDGVAIDIKARVLSTVYAEVKRRGTYVSTDELRAMIGGGIIRARRSVIADYNKRVRGETLREDEIDKGIQESLSLMEQGKTGVDAYSPGLRRAYQRARGKAGNAKELDEFMVNNMKAIIDSQTGKRRYEDPAKIIRETQVKGRTNTNRSAAQTGQDVAKVLFAPTPGERALSAVRLAGSIGNPVERMQAAGQAIKMLSDKLGLPAIKLPDFTKPEPAGAAEVAPKNLQDATAVRLSRHTSQYAPGAMPKVLNEQNMSYARKLLMPQANGMINSSIVRTGPMPPPLPQVAPQTKAQMVLPMTMTNNHPIAMLIGMIEGTRTVSGEYTAAHTGHRDGNRGINRTNTGNYSADARQFRTPQQADRSWNARLTAMMPGIVLALQNSGLPRDTVGHQRLLFNALDLFVSSEAAGNDFIKALPRIAANPTIENIAKARRDAFYDANKRWKGFLPPDEMLREQLKRALTYDYYNPILN